MPHLDLSDDQIFKMITDKEAELIPLYSRMDADRDLYWLKPFRLKVGAEPQEVPHVENVTSNGPRTFADRLISLLTGATKKRIIKSEILTDEEKAEVNDFLDDVDVEMDKWLEKMGFDKGVDNIAFSQLALRGYTDWRYESRMEEGKFIPDLAPWDSRWSAFEYSRDGLGWGSYRSARSKWLIHDQYPQLPLFVDTPVEVVDWYGFNKNLIFIGADPQHVIPRMHGFGAAGNTVIIQKSSSGAFMRDGNFLAHDAESIYAPVRDLYPEKNKALTIMHTLTVASFFGGLQYAGPEGADMTKKPEIPPYGLRFVVPIDKDGGYKAMPVNDIHNATRLGFQIIETDIQNGTFPPTEFGSLEFPMSAVGLVELGQGRDQRVLPIVDGWARFKRRLANMIIDQFIKKNMTATFGHSGKKERTYTADQLKKHQGKYEIIFKFTNVSDRDRIAKIEMARSIPPDLISNDTKRRDVLEMENPDAEQDKINIEAAILAIPEFQLYKYGQSLLRQEPPDEIGALLIADKLDITLAQLESGTFVPPEQPPSQDQGTPMVPLTGGGSANRKSSTERRLEIASEVREPV